MKKLFVKKDVPCMACLECVRACSNAYYKEFHPDKAALKIVQRGENVRPMVCVQCGKCAEACPEGIDLHAGAPTTRLSECVKCGECKHVCPVQAITFPFFPKSGERSVVAVAGESYASETEAAPVVQADAGKCTVAEVAGSNIESKGEAHE